MSDRDRLVTVANELISQLLTGNRVIDLSGADLSGADLSRANLSRANLSGADLSRADLSSADLSRVLLCDCDLEGAVVSFRGKKKKIRFEDI